MNRPRLETRSFGTVSAITGSFGLASVLTDGEPIEPAGCLLLRFDRLSSGSFPCAARHSSQCEFLQYLMGFPQWQSLTFFGGSLDSITHIRFRVHRPVQAQKLSGFLYPTSPNRPLASKENLSVIMHNSKRMADARPRLSLGQCLQRARG